MPLSAIIFKALRKGAVIIPQVSSQLFGKDDGQATATLLTACDDGQRQVTLYDPYRQQECQVPIDAFLKAWITIEGGKCTTAFDDNGTYLPKLMDLTHIELPAELNELMEAMARNAHDMWALERQSEGWSYGPERDDQLLQTPDMVPYEQLSEEEKDYDRRTSEAVLKFIMKEGFSIVKLS